MKHGSGTPSVSLSLFHFDWREDDWTQLSSHLWAHKRWAGTRNWYSNISQNNLLWCVSSCFLLRVVLSQNSLKLLMMQPDVSFLFHCFWNVFLFIHHRWVCRSIWQMLNVWTVSWPDCRGPAVCHVSLTVRVRLRLNVCNFSRHLVSTTAANQMPQNTFWRWEQTSSQPPRSQLSWLLHYLRLWKYQTSSICSNPRFDTDDSKFREGEGVSTTTNPGSPEDAGGGICMQRVGVGEVWVFSSFDHSCRREAVCL